MNMKLKKFVTVLVTIKYDIMFQAICPVCRESINCDVESLWSAPPPIDVEAAIDFSVTAELRELQKQMAALFLRQQRRGGIIDLEAEGVKTLVRTEDEPGATTEGPNPPGTSLNAYSNQNMQPVDHMVCLYVKNNDKDCIDKLDSNYKKHLHKFFTR